MRKAIGIVLKAPITKSGKPMALRVPLDNPFESNNPRPTPIAPLVAATNISSGKVIFNLFSIIINSILTFRTYMTLEAERLATETSCRISPESALDTL